MKDLKPTDPQYIEALALEKLPKLESKHNGLDEIVARINSRNGYIQGAKDILEHTNHAEVLEALKEAHKKLWLDINYHDSLLCKIIDKAIQKSESNKLDK